MTTTDDFDKETDTVEDHASLKPFDVPEAKTKGKCPNNFCLMLLLICLLFLGLFTTVISKGADLNRFFYGSDKCGNTCGSKNVQVIGLNCSGKDLTNKRITLIKYLKTNPQCPFSRVNILPDECVQECNHPNQLIFNRCYPPNTARLTQNSKYMKQLTKIFNIINQNVYVIVLLSMAGIVISFGMLLCLRCHVAVTFCLTTAFQLVTFVLASVYLWRQYITNEESMVFYLFAAIGTTTYVLFLLFFIVCLHNSYVLVFELYKEALRAIFRVPMLLIQPIVTLVFLILTLTAMVILILLISSNKYLNPRAEDFATFHHVSHLPSVGYICYTIFVMLWLYSFIDGCHTMIISGVVSNYYFTRNKADLPKSYSRSVLRMFQHLGTIATGSLIVTLMVFMRSLAEYIVNKAYIQSARHGTPFCTSLVRGVKLLFSNVANTIKITGFNYIVINGSSFQAMLLTMLMGIWLNSTCHHSFYTWIALIFGAFSACLVTLFMMSLINVTSETIYLCFCEDQISNDGNSRPYYMNKRLKQLLEKSKEQTTTYRLNQF